jgi:factor associated with neutral sphingomyelinase activation
MIFCVVPIASLFVSGRGGSTYRNALSASVCLIISEMAASRSTSRFTLLDIEDGEEYLEDFAAFYYPSDLPDAAAAKAKRKGRLRLCTRSIVFEPSESMYPLLRIPFRECEELTRLNPPPTSPLAATELCLLTTKVTVKMKENNVIAPYTVEKACHFVTNWLQ